MKRFLLSLIIFVALFPSPGLGGVAITGASASLLPETMTQDRRIVAGGGTIISG